MKDERKRVIVRVLRPVGYHDDHNPGEIIEIYEDHLQGMLDQGYVEIVLPKATETNESA
ncbi:hypothetical protein [Paenibacillus sp. HJGM_3]|uniref:hypothetical protein n=1 Tax=Paenibacillus sp. HJGM_3 TaxID=3379816 RepID=UPI003858428A